MAGGMWPWSVYTADRRLGAATTAGEGQTMPVESEPEPAEGTVDEDVGEPPEDSA